jgi:hypothetical protein
MQSLQTAPCPDGLDEAAGTALALPDAKAASRALPSGRLDLNPDSVQHDLARLVLCLVEVLRQLMERQALRRVEGGRLTAEQIEALGLTLMRLEERMDELKEHFGVTGEELRLDLGGLIDDI